MEKRKVLALESSAKAASCAIMVGEKLLAQVFVNNGLTHSTTLLPMVERMLESCGLKVTDMDLIAVAKGPGSFTGIRIGVAAAKGLMWGGSVPGVGVSTLEAMAWNCVCMEGAVICAAMDARRNQVYNALFEIREGEPRRITEDRAISLAELAEDLKKIKKAVFLVGDGAELCYNYLLSEPVDCVLAPAAMRFQNACGVAEAARRIPEEFWGDVEPVYLRLSQAERERIERENAKK